MTQNEVARRLGVSRQRVKRLREQGRLTAKWDDRLERWTYDEAPVRAYERHRDAFRARQAKRAARDGGLRDLP